MSNLSWRGIWKRRLWQIRQPESYRNFLSKGRKLDKSRLFALVSFVAFVSVVAFSLLSGILFVVLARELPSPDRIVRKEGFATKIYDRNGKLIYDVFESQKRTPIQLYEVSDYLKKATVAIEDKEFYTHGGFDPKGYLRSFYYTIFARRRLQGGSTLTQQLVKNVLLTPERSIKRKIKEFVLALEIESKYSKDQILQMYFNEAPYGGTIWGVEEAARSYFAKSALELNLTESAFLAGLPQSPTRYSPYGENPTAYIGRTQAVLRRMREDGYITSEEEENSAKEIESMKFSTPSGTLRAPHFVMYIKKILEEKYGEKAVELGGMRVTTTLDLDLQEKAQEIVTNEIKKVESLNITNGASIVLNPQTGEILAMVGSKDYDDPDFEGKFNVVTQGLRQPGSAIKPVTYVTALKKGYTPSFMLMNTLTSFPGGTGQPDYIPTNYDGKEHGPTQLRYGLGNSINITAVKMLALVGVKDTLSVAYDLGLSTLEPSKENLSRLGLSVTLGGGEVRMIELASAYSAFANGGLRVEPVSILKVTDKDGNALEEFKSIPGKRVLTEPEAFLISHILSDNSAREMTFGLNSLLKIANRQVAVKTGTTNDKKDNWAIGWTPQVMVAAWVGNNNNTSMKQVASGVSGATPIWRQTILEALKNLPSVEFEVPSGIVTAEVDIVSGYRAHDGFPQRTEYFIQGTEPSDEDPIHKKLKLCRSQGKLATPVDIARGDYDEKEYFIFKESDPLAGKDSINRWQAGIDNWLSKQEDSRYHPPTDYCGTSDQVHIIFEEPGDRSQVGSGFTIKVKPVSSYDIKSVKIYINGQEKKSFNSRPYEFDITLSDGTYTIKAEAKDEQGHEGSSEIKIGVNIPWDYVEPTATPLPTNTPSPKPTATPTPNL